MSLLSRCLLSQVNMATPRCANKNQSGFLYEMLIWKELQLSW